MKEMTPWRKKIDELDDQIIDLLIQRYGVIHEVGAWKAENDVPPVIQDRVEEVIERNAARAKKSETLDPDFIRKLYTLMIDHAHDVERSYRK